MEMLSTKQKLLFFRWIAVRCTFVTLCLAVITFPAQAEQVPSIPASATATLLSASPVITPLFVCGTMLTAYCGSASSVVSPPYSSPVIEAPLATIIAACAAIGFGYSETLDPRFPAYQQRYWCNVSNGTTSSAANTAYPLDTSCVTGYTWNSSTFMCDPSSVILPTCPAVPAGETTFKLDPGGATCSRPDPVQCPANSTGTPPACVCNAGFKFDAAGTSCVPVAPPVICPIQKFPDINESDACTRSLEKGAGKDVDKVCEPLDPEMVKQEICLGNKIRRLGIPYFEPSATVRTVAYQQHFVDLWEWHEKKIPKAKEDWTDAEKQECAPMVAKVEIEWKKHKLRGKPSNKGPNAPHVLRKAVDIDEAIPKLMMEAVNKTTFLVPFPTYCFLCLPEYPVYIGDVQDYVNNPLVNPPACKLRWGGRFLDKNGKPDPDLVHFDLLLK